MAPKKNQAAQDAFTRRFTDDAPLNASSPVLPARREVLPPGPSPDTDAIVALSQLTVHDNGWIRIVSHDQGRSVYLKFKWSKGPHAGGYVMWLCTDMDFTAAFRGLLQKVWAVEHDGARPTPDHPYE